MPSRIVRQPNGKLGVFSSVVDHFTALNLAEDEALALCAKELGEREGRAKVDRGLNDELPYRPGSKGDGLYRWREALEIVAGVHGKDEVAKLEADAGSE